MASHLLLKRGRYYFRQRIPRPLATSLGRSEIIKALPMCSRPEAVVLARYASARLDLILRQMMNDERISKDRLDNIVREIFADVLAEYDRIRKPRWSEEGLKSARRRHDGAVEQLKMGFTEDAQEFVDEALMKAGISLDRDSHDYKELCLKTLRVLVDATRIHRSRYEGDFSAEPKDPILKGYDQRHIDGLPLSDVFTNFNKDKQGDENWRKKTGRDNRLVQRMAIEWFGDRFISSITRKDAGEFLDMLKRLPAIRGKNEKQRKLSLHDYLAHAENDPNRKRLSTQTVNKHFRNLGAAFKWGVSRGLLDSNPFERIETPRRKTAARKERDEWNIDELKQWFSSPIYRGCKSKARRYERGEVVIKDHFYWLPLMFAYHPIRPTEAAQLYVSDIGEEDGVAFFDISGGTTPSEIIEQGKMLKNDGSTPRRMPLHAFLIELGFLSYVEEQRKKGNKRLFPDIVRKDPEDSMGDAFCKKFRYGLDKLGIKGVVPYGLRHNAITAMAGHSDDATKRRYLQGHALGGQDDRYIKGMPITELKKLVDTITYSGIDKVFFAIMCRN